MIRVNLNLSLAEAERMSEPQTTHLGPYELIEQLAQGAYGEIYRARYVGAAGFQRMVAIKRLRKHVLNDASAVRSFENEARIGGLLIHHNIAQTIEFSQDNGQYYLVMEYVDGISFHELIQVHRSLRKPMPLTVVLELLAQSCDGLHQAHEARGPDGVPLNLIHRDIKPSNLMLTRTGLVKVMDFGIARIDNQNLTDAGFIKGTPRYLSPEMITRNSTLDRRSDLFSLGSVLYEMLTLNFLFDAPNLLTLMTRVRNVEVGQQLGALRTQHPPVVPVLQRMLEAAPARRFQTARELARELRNLRRDLPEEVELETFAHLMLRQLEAERLAGRARQDQRPIAPAAPAAASSGAATAKLTPSSPAVPAAPPGHPTAPARTPAELGSTTRELLGALGEVDLLAASTPAELPPAPPILERTAPTEPGLSLDRVPAPPPPVPGSARAFGEPIAPPPAPPASGRKVGEPNAPPPVPPASGRKVGEPIAPPPVPPASGRKVGEPIAPPPVPPPSGRKVGDQIALPPPAPLDPDPDDIVTRQIDLRQAEREHGIVLPPQTRSAPRTGDAGQRPPLAPSMTAGTDRDDDEEESEARTVSLSSLDRVPPAEPTPTAAGAGTMGGQLSSQARAWFEADPIPTTRTGERGTDRIQLHQLTLRSTSGSMPRLDSGSPVSPDASLEFEEEPTGPVGDDLELDQSMETSEPSSPEGHVRLGASTGWTEEASRVMSPAELSGLNQSTPHHPQVSTPAFAADEEETDGVMSTRRLTQAELNHYLGDGEPRSPSDEDTRPQADATARLAPRAERPLHPSAAPPPPASFYADDGAFGGMATRMVPAPGAPANFPPPPAAGQADDGAFGGMATRMVPAPGAPANFPPPPLPPPYGGDGGEFGGMATRLVAPAEAEAQAKAALGVRTTATPVPISARSTLIPIPPSLQAQGDPVAPVQPIVPAASPALPDGGGELAEKPSPAPEGLPEPAKSTGTRRHLLWGIAVGIVVLVVAIMLMRR